jgi:hypothetical protein
MVNFSNYILCVANKCLSTTSKCSCTALRCPYDTFPLITHASANCTFTLTNNGHFIVCHNTENVHVASSMRQHICSDIRVVGANPTRGTDVCVFILCADSGLTTS